MMHSIGVLCGLQKITGLGTSKFSKLHNRRPAFIRRVRRTQRQAAIVRLRVYLIIAWRDGTGNLPALAKRRRAVWAMLPKSGIYCSGTTENGQPRYPKPWLKFANTDLHIQKWLGEL